MRFLFALAVVAISSCPWSVTAATRESAIQLSFKTVPQVNGATVHVNEIVLVRSSDASAAIAAGQGEIALQPGPGPSAVISRQDVVAAIGKVDSALLARLQWNGADQVGVAKPGRWLDVQESTANAEQALRLWLGSRAKTYELQPSANVDRKWIEAEAKVQYVIPSTAKIRRQMPVQVEITDVGGKSRSFPLWFTVSAVQDTWVLVRDMNAGELIFPGDLIVQATDIAALNGESLSPDFHLDGQMMVVPVKAGAVLLQSFIKPRPDVLVGETVAVRLNTPMVQLETTGLALHSAERGSRVLIRNVRSGETLTARVTDRDVVEVRP